MGECEEVCYEKVEVEGGEEKTSTSILSLFKRRKKRRAQSHPFFPST